jgi:hypothetical protein
MPGGAFVIPRGTIHDGSRTAFGRRRVQVYNAPAFKKRGRTSGNRSWPCRRAPRPGGMPWRQRYPAHPPARRTGTPAGHPRHRARDSGTSVPRRPRLSRKICSTFARRVSTSTPDFVRLNLAYRGPGFCTCFVRSLSRQREDPDRYAGSARCVLVPRPRVVYRSRVRS